MWLDQRLLAENLLQHGQRLAFVRYFTTRVLPEPNDPGKPGRQNAYLEALATLPEFYIHEGFFLAKEGHCTRCGATWNTYEEKMTDVNLAVAMLGDAQDDAFDTAIVISGDGDLTGPIRAVRTRYPAKRIVVAFPPNRHSVDLRNVATTSFTIGRKKFLDSQFPDQVVKPDGYVLAKPLEWS